MFFISSNPIVNYLLIFSAIVILSIPARAQVVKSVVLDSVVVQAVKKGFSVEDFIEMVQADTSFLRAFRYTRSTAHHVEGTMTVYGRKKRVVAKRYNRATQQVTSSRRWMVHEEEKVEGKFYNRKNEPGSYTAELFDDIFFIKIPCLLPILQFQYHRQQAPTTRAILIN